MTGYGRILIVDDMPAFVETYQELLSAEGYVVQTATTRAAALQRLDEPGWSVVLVDQKLQGPGGPDTGLGLIAEVRRRAPGAKAILVTAYASSESVERAFRDGAYDYLEKTPVFEALLRIKVRNAMEALRERWLATLDLDEAEAAIQQTWAKILTEQDTNRKGILLEGLVALLLKSIPGFERVDTRLRNEHEELDVLVQNNSVDPFWQKESPYILVECKNWSKHVGTKELRDLWGKMEGRYDRCRLSLFVAPGGFADTVRAWQLRKAEKNMLVMLVGPGDLEELVMRKDRNDALKAMHQHAVVASFEHHMDSDDKKSPGSGEENA